MLFRSPWLSVLVTPGKAHLDAETAAYLAGLLVCAQTGTVLPVSAWRTALPILLAATSVYGIAQRLGIAEFCGYGAVGEPVSVFGNLNVAAEATATGLAACLALGLASLRLPLVALALGGAYLAINGSRSSAVALADRKSTRLNSSHSSVSRMPSSA